MNESRMLRKYNPIIATFAVVALILLGSPAASADYYSGGHATAKFNYRPVSVNSAWVGHFNAGAKAWNATGGGTTISQVTGSRSTVTAAYTSNTWYGYYQPSGTRALRQFKIQVNTRTLNRDYGSSTNAYRSTAAHEFGHGLSLLDNPSTSKASLMKHSRNRLTVVKPQSYDISELRRIY